MNGHVLALQCLWLLSSTFRRDSLEISISTREIKRYYSCIVVTSTPVPPPRDVIMYNEVHSFARAKLHVCRFRTGIHPCILLIVFYFRTSNSRSIFWMFQLTSVHHSFFVWSFLKSVLPTSFSFVFTVRSPHSFLAGLTVSEMSPCRSTFTAAVEQWHAVAVVALIESWRRTLRPALSWLASSSPPDNDDRPITTPLIDSSIAGWGSPGGGTRSHQAPSRGCQPHFHSSNLTFSQVFTLYFAYFSLKIINYQVLKPIKC